MSQKKEKEEKKKKNSPLSTPTSPAPSSALRASRGRLVSITDAAIVIGRSAASCSPLAVASPGVDGESAATGELGSSGAGEAGLALSSCCSGTAGLCGRWEDEEVGGEDMVDGGLKVGLVLSRVVVGEAPCNMRFWALGRGEQSSSRR